MGQGRHRTRLQPFFDDLVLITRGPIWSAERWGAIIRMNLGLNSDDVDREFYRNPPPTVDSR